MSDREPEPLSVEALLALAEALPAAAPSSELKVRLLATLSSPDRFAPFLPALTQLFDLPAAAMGEVLALIDASANFLTASPGVRYRHFAPGPACAGAEAGIVLLEPGAEFPRHRHLGQERTIVLEGYMRDGETVHGPGALVEHPADTSHDYQATLDRPLAIMVLHQGIEIEGPGGTSVGSAISRSG